MLKARDFEVVTPHKKKLVGAAITYYRIKNLIKNNTLCELSGLSYPSILNYENGNTKTAMVDINIEKIANALGVTLDDLMKKSEKMDPYLNDPTKFKELLENSKKNFGLNLMFAREYKGLSKQDLADKLDVTSSKIYYWENGKTIPKYEYFKRLYDALEITHEDLVKKATEPMKRIISKDEKSKKQSKKAKKYLGYGTNIRYYRAKKDYSIMELSRVSGVPYSNLNIYEHGSRDDFNLKPAIPKMNNLEKIAKALDVTVEQLQEEPSEKRIKFVNNIDSDELVKRKKMAINFQYFLYANHLTVQDFINKFLDDESFTERMLSSLKYRTYSSKNKVFKTVANVITKEDPDAFLDDEEIRSKLAKIKKSNKLTSLNF